MSSSLRNSLHRRNHKERSQLAHRARFGLLEKHKDYVLRARDYHSKKERIQRLRQKAADRNKDEFYFGMNRQRTKAGVHVQERGNIALPTDIVKVLKTQDENYIRTMRVAGLKKIDKLKNQLGVLTDLVPAAGEDDAGWCDEESHEEDRKVLEEAGILPPSEKSARKKPKHAASRHIVFVDDTVSARSTEMQTDTSPRATSPPVSSSSAQQDLGWKVPGEAKQDKKGKRKQTDVDGVALSAELAAETAVVSKEHRGRLLKELSARLTRDRQLRYATRELEMQRLLMTKGGRRKLQGVEKVEDDEEEDEDSDDDDRPKRTKVDDKAYKPRVYKWRMERKR